MTVKPFEAVGVLGRELDTTAVRAANHQRHRYLATGKIAELGGVLDDLVGGLEREVPGHHFDDRTHTGHRHPDRRAGKPVFGDRGIDHATGAELIDQAIRDEVRATIDSNVLTEQDYPLIPFHFFRHRGAQGIAIGYDWHAPVSFPGWSVVLFVVTR